MLEDVNNILNAGDVPNLYGPEELDQIMTKCRADCVKLKIPPTKINIFNAYVARVRRNLHVVLAMSPLGDAFRTRLRMFPSLVNCCTIDFFNDWPAEALLSVANWSISTDESTLKIDKELVEPITTFFGNVHTSVTSLSKDFYEVMRRHNYVTPTSYLELLKTFKASLIGVRGQVGEKKDRLANGLDKIISTESIVGDLQQQLREMQPVLAKTQVEVEELIEVIAKDTAEANVTKEAVAKEEAAANKMAAECKEIADDAQRDLDEALPALDEAVACLKELKKADIDEVKNFKNPPAGAKLTMETVCIMFGVAPVRVPDPDRIGKKLNDFWKAAQGSVLSNATGLLQDLKDYDKDNIDPDIIEKIEPYIENPDFTPKAIEKASKACKAMCMWVRAMYKYDTVAKQVEPKKQKLAEASAKLEKTMAVLAKAKEQLRLVEDKIKSLEDQCVSDVGAPSGGHVAAAPDAARARAHKSSRRCISGTRRQTTRRKNLQKTSRSRRGAWSVPRSSLAGSAARRSVGLLL